MIAAVVGGSGFVGSHLIRRLAVAGYAVRSVDRRPVMEGIPNVSSHPTGDRSVLAKVFEGCDVVFHLAARSGGIGLQGEDHHQVFLFNSRLTGEVLAAASITVPRLFMASSAVVYRPSEHPLVESDPTVTLEDRPSGYAWSKVCDELAGNWVSQTTPLDVLVGRFTNIYGPRGHGRGTVVHDLVERALGAKGPFEVWGDGRAVRSFIAVEDAAAATAHLGLNAAAGTYNVDSGVPTSIAALAGLIARRVGGDVSPRFDQSRPTGSPYRVLDIGRLRATTWEPQMELDIGISALVEYERARLAAGRT